MNSFNHYSLGSCGEWLYDTVAGIGGDADAPGDRRMVIRPRPGGGLTFVRAARQTIYGKVESAWRMEGNQFTLEVTLPANTTARVILPVVDAAMVTEGGKPVTEARDVTVTAATEGYVTLEIGSGTYRFAASMKNGTENH